METPQQIAESFRSPIANGERFAASISGPRGSGKTSVLAQLIQIVIDLGWNLNDVAAFAPTHRAVRHLRRLAARPWPDLDEDQLLADHLSGTPYTALRTHTQLPGDGCDARILMRAYLDHLANLNALDPGNPPDVEFLASLTPRLRAGIDAEREARCAGTPLPRNVYLQAIADFVAEYKSAYGLLDLADLMHADYYTSPNVRLLLLDEVNVPDRRLIERLFPNAAVIAASLAPSPADLSIELPRCLRAPERIDIYDSEPLPQLVPPLPEFSSLFVFTARWRIGPWLRWIRAQELANVKLVWPACVEQLETEIAIADGTWFADAASADIAMTRATKQLIVLHKVR